MIGRGTRIGFGLALLAGCAFAQRVEDTVFGTHAQGQFGHSVDGVGDIDGDGKEEFVVGIPRSIISPVVEEPGVARVFSGADRSIMYEVQGNHPVDLFGYAVAGVGDLNGDSVPDFAVGAPGDSTAFSVGGMVRTFSGADGSVLWTRYGERVSDFLGLSVSHVGDVDGDGNDDVLAGAPYAGFTELGYVRVFSGATSLTIHTVAGDEVGDHFGASVGSTGDVDGDGRADFAAVAPLAAVSYAKVLSGLDASTVHHLPSREERVRAVLGVGDVDGDGTNDIAVGEGTSGPGGGVFVYSGADRSLVLAVPDVPGGGALGSSLAAPGDVDRDGTPDILVSAKSDSTAGTSAGAVLLISGSTGATLLSILGDAELDRVGDDVAVADVDDDGVSDFLVSQTTDSDVGRVRIHLSNTPVGDVYCTAEINSTNRSAAISLEGLNSISANNLLLRSVYVPPGMNGLFIYSPDQDLLPLGNGNLCLGSQSQGFIHRLPFEQSSPLGVMEHALDVTAPGIPEGMILAGSTWHFQAFFRDIPAGGAGFNFSDAISVAFAP